MGVADPAGGMRGRGRYGIDGGPIVMPVFGLIEVGLASTVIWAVRRRRHGVAGLALLGGGLAGAVATGYAYSSGRGKLSIWAELLDELALGGDERVLDVGCGRGAVLVLAAHRLAQGRAVGADIWRRIDQSGNTPTAAEHNAVVEGVSDRVELVDADARDLPFPPGSFDLVVSNLTIHNIVGADGQRRALEEIVRVLRPGGRVRIVDLHAARYVEALRAAGCVDVTTRRLDWRTWFGIPGHHLTLVGATRPFISDTGSG